MITRLAPTPSGFLHRGNAVNLLLVSWLARQLGGIVALRIDDMDAPRYRPEYVDDAFRVLDWLGVGWERGPRTPLEFRTDYSMRHRTAYYRAELEEARTNGLATYACRCTRAEASAAGSAGCVGDCISAGRPLVAGESALRARLRSGPADPVLWRRDDLPAYHLVSVVEDRDLGTTHVVRGEDLREASAVQVVLAPFLRADRFADAVFVHHPLLVGDDGIKLSKSRLSAGPMERSAEQRDTISVHAARMAAALGINPPG